MTLLHMREHTVHHRSCGPTAAAIGPAELADALAGLDFPDPGGIWLIRRLVVRAAAGPGAGTIPSSAELARQILRAVQRAVDAGPDGDGVLWFADRAAFLGQWLTDVSLDRAGGHWEYAEFDAAPFSAAVRHQASIEPTQLLAALLALPAAELDRMVAMVSPPDAATIVHTIAARDAHVDVRAVAAAVTTLRDAGRLPPDARLATLAVVLVLALDGEVGVADAGAARDLVLATQALRRANPAELTELVTGLRAADAPALARLGHSALAAALAGWPATARAAALDVLVPTLPAGPEPAYTRLGGLFLLLPLLAELPLAEATASWPDCRGVGADRVVAALALGAVLGVGTAGTADPWARTALGLPEDLGRNLVDWSRELTAQQRDLLAAALAPALDRRAATSPADLDDVSLLLDPPLAPATAAAVRPVAAVLLRELSHRLPGMAQATAGHLRRNVLALDATVRADDTCILVELGRAPLSILLSLTGLNRRRFVLDATGGRPWVLTQRC